MVLPSQITTTTAIRTSLCLMATTSRASCCATMAARTTGSVCVSLAPLTTWTASVRASAHRDYDASLFKIFQVEFLVEVVEEDHRVAMVKLPLVFLAMRPYVFPYAMI